MNQCCTGGLSRVFFSGKILPIVMVSSHSCRPTDVPYPYKISTVCSFSPRARGLTGIPTQITTPGRNPEYLHALYQISPGFIQEKTNKLSSTFRHFAIKELWAVLSHLKMLTILIIIKTIPDDYFLPTNCLPALSAPGKPPTALWILSPCPAEPSWSKTNSKFWTNLDSHFKQDHQRWRYITVTIGS